MGIDVKIIRKLPAGLKPKQFSLPLSLAKKMITLNSDLPYCKIREFHHSCGYE
jgi:hypothetical protein